MRPSRRWAKEEEALGYLRRALHRHEQELRADTANLFSRLAVVEDLARICKILARLGRPDAPPACARTSSFAEAIAVVPEHAFPRAFLAAAWTDVGEAYDTLAGRYATAESDRRRYRLAAMERHRKSHEIWSDAARASARAERVLMAADR